MTFRPVKKKVVDVRNPWHIVEKKEEPKAKDYDDLSSSEEESPLAIDVSEEVPKTIAEGIRSRTDHIANDDPAAGETVEAEKPKVHSEEANIKRRGNQSRTAPMDGKTYPDMEEIGVEIDTSVKKEITIESLQAQIDDLFKDADVELTVVDASDVKKKDYDADLKFKVVMTGTIRMDSDEWNENVALLNEGQTVVGDKYESYDVEDRLNDLEDKALKEVEEYLSDEVAGSLDGFEHAIDIELDSVEYE